MARVENDNQVLISQVRILEENCRRSTREPREIWVGDRIIVN